MIRLLTILLIWWLLLACINTGGKGRLWPKTDVGKERLLGNVKSVEETRYAVDEKGNKDSLGIRIIQRFDIQGNMVEHSDTDSRTGAERQGMDPMSARRDMYTYDSYRRVIEQVDYRGAPRNTMSKSITEYSADGRHSVGNDYENGVVTSKTVSSYDSRGNKIIDSMFNAHDTLLERTVFSYDDSDNPVSESKFNGENKLTEVTKWKYDRFHNELESDVFDAVGNTHWVVKSSYDTSGNPIEQRNYFKDRLANAYTLKYERLDNHGNWLIQKEYSAGQLQYITERLIEYWYGR
jgi:hypothetical protein